jgi:predicted enzyme related to lactoylglutathione lyase
MKYIFATAFLGAALFGATASLAQHEALAPSSMMTPRVALVRIYVTDTMKSERFYMEVFGLQPARGSDGARRRVLAFADANAPRLSLALTDTPPPNSDFTYLAVAVADLEAALSRTIAAGGSVVRAPSNSMVGARVAFIKDLDGNRIELIGSLTPG